MSACRVATTHRSMLPWALDRHDPMPAARTRRAGRQMPSVPPGGAKPLQVSRLPRGTRRQRFSALSGSERPDAASDPEPEGPKVGRPPVRFAGSPKTATLPVRPVRLPKEPDRDRSQRSRSSRRTPRICAPPHPEGSGRAPIEIPRDFHRAGPFHPKVLGLRPSRRALRRAAPRPQRAAPEGWHRWCETHPGLACHPEVTRARSDGSPSARMPEGMVVDAPLNACPEGHALEPARTTPGGIVSSWRPRRSEDRRGSWLRLSSELEAGLGPDRHRLHPNGQESPKTVLSPARRPTSRRTIRRPSVESAVVPRSPPVRVVLRRGSRSPRGRSEPKLVAGVPEPKPEDAFTPATPKRPWSPAPVTRCGR